MLPREFFDRMDRERAEQRLQRERDCAHYEQQRATERANAAEQSARRAAQEAAARADAAWRAAGQEVEETREELAAAEKDRDHLRAALAGLVEAYGVSRLPSGAATWIVSSTDGHGEIPPDVLRRQNDAWARALAALEDGT